MARPSVKLASVVGDGYDRKASIATMARSRRKASQSRPPAAGASRKGRSATNILARLQIEPGADGALPATLQPAQTCLDSAAERDCYFSQTICEKPSQNGAVQTAPLSGRRAGPGAPIFHSLGRMKPLMRRQQEAAAARQPANRGSKQISSGRPFNIGFSSTRVPGILAYSRAGAALMTLNAMAAYFIAPADPYWPSDDAGAARATSAFLSRASRPHPWTGLCGNASSWRARHSSFT